jgi:hypothetical protein
MHHRHKPLNIIILLSLVMICCSSKQNKTIVFSSCVLSSSRCGPTTEMNPKNSQCKPEYVCDVDRHNENGDYILGLVFVKYSSTTRFGTAPILN